MKKLKVLFVSAECEPYAKTGGLGDVAGALPEALSLEGIDVRRVMPLYSSIKCNVKYKVDFPVFIGKGMQTCNIKVDSEANNIPTYFVCNDWYFSRSNIYGYYDDGERFLFFCRAVIEMLKYISFKPDIIHCNDWHTGLIPFIIRSGNYDIKSVYTIHNLKYQGFIPAEFLQEGEQNYLRNHEGINFMESGIMYSDSITTVSSGYASEILTPEMGEGMDNLLKKNKDKLSGIMNGIDLKIYNPSKTGGLEFPYSYQNIEEKEKNKLILKKDMGLNESNLPIISAVTRLDSQKGIDILIEAISRMNMEGFQFILLGTGDMRYQRRLEDIAKQNIGKIAVRFTFDSTLAGKIYAGSDIFVMPSLYEPGGLGQLYAMAYGTVPVVRNTGGLKDSIIDPSVDIEKANGFCFDDFTPTALQEALMRAINFFKTPDFRKLIYNGMSADLSWKKPTFKYMTLYEKLLQQ